jgi:hypothetical protein
MTAKHSSLITSQLIVTDAHASFLVVELPVLVLSEKCDPDGWQGLGLE